VQIEHTWQPGADQDACTALLVRVKPNQRCSFSRSPMTPLSHLLHHVLLLEGQLHVWDI
jgi:hypothetical protein